MTVSDPVRLTGSDADLHLYVDSKVWHLVRELAIDFIGDSDGEMVVGTVSAFHPELLPDAVGAERLLDQHWIVHVSGDSNSRQGTERAFFACIADHYELEVDPERNCDNVRGLLGHLQTPRGSTILDFGCGPGLSLRVAGPYHLVGCDVSATMRARARANGLATIEPMDLRSHEDSFDGMFASYVFHLVVPEEDLLAAVRCIRRGGRIAINFHKGCGLKEVESAMTQDEGLRELAVSPREHPIHGSIRVWQRGQ